MSQVTPASERRLILGVLALFWLGVANGAFALWATERMVAPARSAESIPVTELHSDSVYYFEHYPSGHDSLRWMHIPVTVAGAVDQYGVVHALRCNTHGGVWVNEPR